MNSTEYKDNNRSLLSEASKLRKLFDGYTLGMGFFTAWLYTFPMYGPLLESGSMGKKANPSALFLIFIFSHALGLFCSGIFLKKVDASAKDGNRTNNRSIRILLNCCILLCAFVTFSFVFVSANALPILMFIAGIASAVTMVVYQVRLSGDVKKKERGKQLGFALLLAELLHIPFTLPVVKGVALPLLFSAAGLLLIVSLVLYRCIDSDAEIEGQPEEHGYDLNFGILLVIIGGYYIVGGLIYSIVYPQWFSAHLYSAAISNMFYMLAAPAAGAVADGYGRKHLILFGLSGTGIGYLIMVFSLNHSMDIISLCVLQAAFAAVDIFVFLTLADFAACQSNPYRALGIGLSLNVFSIFISNYILNNFTNSLVNSISVRFYGIVIIFILIPFTTLLRRQVPVKDGSGEPIQQADNVDYKRENSPIQDFNSFAAAYKLTPRETQIAALIHEGKALGEISEALSITNNTLKTHLRNIYGKTETANQKDLLLLMWKSINQIQQG